MDRRLLCDSGGYLVRFPDWLERVGSGNLTKGYHTKISRALNVIKVKLHDNQGGSLAFCCEGLRKSERKGKEMRKKCDKTRLVECRG